VKLMELLKSIGLAGMLAFASAGLAAAQTDFPNKNITLIVPFSAGGGEQRFNAECRSSNLTARQRTTLSSVCYMET
jgi:tripartite-type tricarboxylate transporter receptor subunit TctC